MANVPDPYDLLQVPKDADLSTIRKAFRKRAGKAHPDKGGSHQQMAEINRAYDLLSDPARRENYDRTGTDATKPDPRLVAEAKIRNLFQQYLDAEQEPFGNLIETFKQAVTNHQRQTEQTVMAARRKITRCEKSLKRFKGPKLLQDLVNQKILECKHMIARSEDDIEIDKLVLEMLDQFSDTDPQAPASQYVNLTGLMHSTFGGGQFR